MRTKPDREAEEQSRMEQLTIQANKEAIAKDERRKLKAKEKKRRQRARRKAEKVCLIVFCSPYLS